MNICICSFSRNKQGSVSLDPLDLVGYGTGQLFLQMRESVGLKVIRTGVFLRCTVRGTESRLAATFEVGECQFLAAAGTGTTVGV